MIGATTEPEAVFVAAALSVLTVTAVTSAVIGIVAVWAWLYDAMPPKD